MTMRLQLFFAAVSGMALTASAAAAQIVAQDPPATQLDDVVVTALPLGRSADDVVSSVAVLSGDELVHRRQATLGETLAGIPGVSSDTFGGGASRPVIRGQTSPRVRVLSNGAALLDASEVSPDHAVSVEPLLVEGIEILRGPSALLYGGGAIGGAVNVVDRRIPTRPLEGVSGAAEVRAGTADEEQTVVAGVTVGLGDLAFRLEALKRRSDDYAVPNYEPPHDHQDGETHADEGSFDRLAGSFNDTTTFTLGGSWTGERGYLGAAYTAQDSDYGLPGHSHAFEGCHPHGLTLHCGDHEDGEEEDHDHAHGDAGHEAPVIHLRSRRVDVRGELRQPTAGIERLSLRAGFTDYVHDEREGEVVATSFANQGYDLRLEAQHAPVGVMRGVVGIQSSRADFAAIGDEAFLPESETVSTAVFALEELDFGAIRLELAGRQERQEVRALDRVVKHDPASISGGAVWSFTPGWTAAMSVSRSQRAPTAQELFAHGVHLATNTFEIGSEGLDVETANAAEISLRRTGGATTFSASAYRYQYDGYIYAETLDAFEDFRLIRYGQRDAVFTGVEGEVGHRFSPWLSAEVFGDYVRARFKDGGGNAPRIPAARLGARVEFMHGDWSGDVEYQRVFEQADIAAFETETPGYDMLNATVARDLKVGATGVQVYVRGNNLLDELALNHASFLADVAPLRGRNLVLGVRATF